MGNVRTGFENSGRLHSGNIWKDCPIEDIRNDPTAGFYVFDDFVMAPNSVGTTITTMAGLAGYNAYGGTHATIAALTSPTSGASGELKVYGDTDGDSVSCSVQVPGWPFKISGISGSKTKKLWFEARVAVSSIADSNTEAFVGLAEPLSLAAAVPITDTAATLADQNIVGFYRTESDGDKWQFSYKANGVTAVTSHATLATPVASTYMKLGMKFDPDANTLKVFIDGTETALTTPIISTQLGATAGTDFPNDVFMSPVLAIRNATGSSPGYLLCDWFACAQLA